MTNLEDRLREWITSKADHYDTGTLNCLSEVAEILDTSRDEPTTVEYVEEVNLHEHSPDCRGSGCIAVSRVNRSSDT